MKWKTLAFSSLYEVSENGQFGLDDFNTPTEAYEAAIEYILNNLI